MATNNFDTAGYITTGLERSSLNASFGLFVITERFVSKVFGVLYLNHKLFKKKILDLL